jgi:H/ACA ribonucleoprotein complex non-core subunit NAF1
MSRPWQEDIKNGVSSKGDDEDDEDTMTEPPKTKNEVAASSHALPPPPLLPIGEHEHIVAIGEIVSVVGDTMVVQSLKGRVV